MSERPLIDDKALKCISLAQETQFADNGIVSRTIVRTDRMRVVLFGFAAGQELTEHSSTFQATVQVLTGSCEFMLSGQKHQMKAGDFLYMPANAPHALKAAEQFSMLLTLCKP